MKIVNVRKINVKDKERSHGSRQGSGQDVNTERYNHSSNGDYSNDLPSINVKNRNIQIPIAKTESKPTQNILEIVQKTSEHYSRMPLEGRIHLNKNILNKQLTSPGDNYAMNADLSPVETKMSPSPKKSAKFSQKRFSTQFVSQNGQNFLKMSTKYGKNNNDILNPE